MIAMPLLGSGAGGFRQRMRRYAQRVVGRLSALASQLDADVVVVVHGGDPHAAVWMETCRRALREEQVGDVASAAAAGRGVGALSAGWCAGRSAPAGGGRLADAAAAVEVLRRRA